MDGVWIKGLPLRCAYCKVIAPDWLPKPKLWCLVQASSKPHFRTFNWRACLPYLVNQRNRKFFVHIFSLSKAFKGFADQVAVGRLPAMWPEMLNFSGSEHFRGQNIQNIDG